MSHKLNLVNKPWGYEYLVYENQDVALWYLHIDKDQKTSMHCHPKKTTGLVLLDGIAEVSFLADKRIIKSLDKVMIRRGLFHSTKALSDSGICLFEIETPKDKQDLVRLDDQYGRVHVPYEDQRFEESKTENCLWIDDPRSNVSDIYNFANCKLEVVRLNSIDDISNIEDDTLMIFLSGGMIRNVADISHCVTVPGDVGYAKIIKQVSKNLDGISNNTIIMKIIK